MKQLKNSLAWYPLVVAIALTGGIWIGIKFGSNNYSTDGERKLAEVLDLIKDEYVDEVDIDSLLERTFPNLLSNLDPHSTYIPAKELLAVNEDLEGSFSGIGISFTMLTDTVTVNEVIPGGPSEKIGLMAGDRIMTINDSAVAGMNIPNTEIKKMLRGEKGTKVKLGIKRNNTKKTLSFEVTRGDIPVNSVDAAYMIDDTTGYIKVNKFGRTTRDEFLTGLVKLKAQGADRYIVDLRGKIGRAHV